MPISLSPLILIVTGLLASLAVIAFVRRPRGQHTSSATLRDPSLGVVTMMGVGAGAVLVQQGGPMSLAWMLVGSLVGVISADLARSGRLGARSGDTPLRARLRGFDEGVRAALLVFWCGLLGVAGFLGATAVIDASASAISGDGAGPALSGLVLLAALGAATLTSLQRRATSTLPALAAGWGALALAPALRGGAAANSSLPDLGSPALADTLGLGPFAGLAFAGVGFGLTRGLALGVLGAGLGRTMGASQPWTQRLLVTAWSFALPLVGGASVLLAGVPTGEPVAERTDSDARSRSVLLGPVHARGLLPHLQRGQIIVLPEDTPLLPDQRYAMRFQAPPRGAKVGRLEARRGFIRLPDWAVADDVDHVWFRPRDPERSKLPSWDLRVPVTRSSVEATVADPKSTNLTEGERLTVEILRPEDPDISFAILAAQMDGPFIPLSDLHFVGSTGKAVNDRYGEFIAMYEVRDEDAPPRNPTLREAVSAGFSGPFFDTTTGEPPLPVALVATETLPGAVGDRVEFTMPAPRRGLTAGRLISGEDGRELATPAWAELAGVRLARHRHREDPTRDIVFPVRRRLASDGTFRFRAASPGISMNPASLSPRFEGPYLEVPDLAVTYTLHSDARLPAALSGRRALVAEHGAHAPESPQTSGLLSAHPLELELAGMPAPVRAYDGVGWVGHAVATRLGDRAGQAFALVTALLMAAALLVALGPSGHGPCSRSTRVVSVVLGWCVGIVDAGAHERGGWSVTDLAVSALGAAMIWLVLRALVQPRRAS